MATNPGVMGGRQSILFYPRGGEGGVVVLLGVRQRYTRIAGTEAAEVDDAET